MIKKEISYLEIWLLIRQGAKVIKFQHFANKIKEHKQIFKTKVVWKGVICICYHHRPFPFMVDRKGKIFGDREAAGFISESEQGGNSLKITECID